MDSDNSLPPILSIVSLGKPSPSSSSTTTTTPTNAAAAAAETARTAAANSINAFKSLSKTYPWSLKFTALAGSAQGCAEGVTLATFTGNDTLKTRKSPVITCTGHGLDVDSWDRGILFAQAQNKARELADMPGNQ